MSYRFNANIIGRSDGKSAVASAAYRSGEKLHDERTGQTKYYARKVKPDTEIMAPENAPSWVYNREKLWNEVEKREDKSNKRDTAQLAREVVLNLPVGLPNDKQKELVREFIKEHYVDKGMIADIAIHRDDPNNPHAHVMLTMRTITENGFGNKERTWNQKCELTYGRELWANHENKYLERAGLDIRVDHRSYKDRGLEIKPTKHLGPAAHSLEKRGVRTEIGDYNRAVKAYNQTVISLAEYREKKQEIQQQQEQKKHFSPAEIAQLKEASKVLKGYATIEKIQEHYGKLDKKEQRIQNNIEYLKWKNDTIQNASSIYQNIHILKERIHESQERIQSINWLNPFKLGNNKAIKEINEKDIQKYQSSINHLENKANAYLGKLKVGNEQEFYELRNKFSYDSLLHKNLTERKELNHDRETLMKAEQVLQQGFVRQVASNYGELPELNYMSYDTAQKLDSLNKDGIKTPEKIDDIIQSKEQEIKDIESQLNRVTDLQGRVERVESYLNKYEQMDKVVQKMENSPIIKAKMMISKSTKAEYEQAVSTKENMLAAAKAEGIPSKEELTVQKDKLERMRANVPAAQNKIEAIKKDLAPYKSVQRGIEKAKQNHYKAATRNIVGQRNRNRDKGMAHELERGRMPRRNRDISR